MNDLNFPWLAEATKFNNDLVKSFEFFDFDPDLRAFLLVRAERARQDAKWGDQSHRPDGTGALKWAALADDQKQATDEAAEDGSLTWRHILLEEVYEAFAESDPEKLTEELIQVAAVALAWAKKHLRDVDNRPPTE